MVKIMSIEEYLSGHSPPPPDPVLESTPPVIDLLVLVIRTNANILRACAEKYDGIADMMEDANRDEPGG